MGKILKWATFLVCLVSINKGFSQSPLDGNWYSTGTVAIEGSTNSYLGELKLKQKGRAVSGQFNYYFRDSLFSVPVSGEFDLNSRYILIKSFPIILHSSTNTKMGVDCYMRGEFMLRISRVGSYLSGKFIAEENYKYTCPEIAFTFEKNSDTSTNPIQEAKQVSAAPIAKITNKDSVTTHTVDPVIALITKQFEERPKFVFKDLYVDSSTIDLEFVDNGAIDYDSISVFLNNKLILKKTMLTHSPIKLKIKLDTSIPVNELSMFANNEGLIPPNTATLTVIDGDNKTDIDMTSSLHSTATLKLKRWKK
jgi:hypothetical protein